MRIEKQPSRQTVRRQHSLNAGGTIILHSSVFSLQPSAFQKHDPAASNFEDTHSSPESD